MPWICGSIERNTFYEFKLRFADHARTVMPGAAVVRIRSDLEIQMGEVSLDPAPPELQTHNSLELYELEWRQRLKWKHNIRIQVQRELKKMLPTPVIVIRVNPQVDLETIAIVWTSIEAVSKATLYLDVSGD